MSTISIITEIALVAFCLSLSVSVYRQDRKSCEIDAWKIYALTGALLTIGLTVCLPGLTVWDHLMGAVVAGGLGLFARCYAYLRTGVPAFGAADILLMVGFGGTLGAFAAAPWLITACILGLAAFTLPERFALAARHEDVDGKIVKVIPFCPAIIITGWITWGVLRAGVIAPTVF